MPYNLISPTRSAATSAGWEDGTRKPNPGAQLAEVLYTHLDRHLRETRSARPPGQRLAATDPLWYEGSLIQAATEADLTELGWGWDERGEPERSHPLTGELYDPYPVEFPDPAPPPPAYQHDLAGYEVVRHWRWRYVCTCGAAGQWHPVEEPRPDEAGVSDNAFAQHRSSHVTKPGRPSKPSPDGELVPPQKPLPRAKPEPRPDWAPGPPARKSRRYDRPMPAHLLHSDWRYPTNIHPDDW